jgi:hypothetical protein
MGIAPNPGFPEVAPYTYERKMALGQPGLRGPLRFEEGIATDTDVPNDFQRGMMEATSPAPGTTSSVNPDTQYKHANETMAERAHVGSAAWVESPQYLSDYASGAGEGNQIEYVMADRSGGRYSRVNPALVVD